MEELKNWIETELPSAREWYKQHNLELFINAAEKMLNAGMEQDVIKSILEDCYCAVASEFGN